MESKKVYCIAGFILENHIRLAASVSIRIDLYDIAADSRIPESTEILQYCI